MGNALTVGNEYYNYMEMYKKADTMGWAAYIMQGQAISGIKRGQLWRIEGGHVKSFSHWCKNVLHKRPSQCHRQAQIYQRFGQLLSDTQFQMEVTKIVLALPLIAGAED